MMKVKTMCNHCGKTYQMAPEYIGKTAKCKQCQNNFVMVAMEEPEAAQALMPLHPFAVTDQASYGAGAPQAPVAAPPQAAQQNPFGAPQQAAPQSPFGAPPQQAAPQSPFGAPPQQAAPQSPFGAPPQAAPQSPFGAPQQAAQQSPFGAPPQAAQQSPFGAPPQAAQQSPFGAPQQAAQQSPFGAPPQNSFNPGGNNPFASPTQLADPYSAPQPQVQAQPQVQPQSSRQPIKNEAPMQTVVCPKCKFTAGIPAIGSKIRLRCQECGHKFIIKPDPKLKKLVKSSPAKGPKEKKPTSKGAIIGLAALLIVIAILFVGPIVLPGVIPSILPF
ncbi:hypothetical protein LJB99_04195 [Deltaproteobacteria bacterium OttesenSCG-928-K17]|nr:hypothetical protein [Deltaproteobacteria bacterium OttesenSCG-928-K17]